MDKRSVKPGSLADVRARLEAMPETPCTVQAGKTLGYAERESDRGKVDNAQRLLRRALTWMEGGQ